MTNERTDGHRAFYNLPSRAYRPVGDKNLYAAPLDMCSATYEKLQVAELLERQNKKTGADLIAFPMNNQSYH